MSPDGRPAFRTVAFGDAEGRLWGAAVQPDPTRPAGLVLGSDGRSMGEANVEWTVEGRAWRLTGEGFELRAEARGETPASDRGNGDAPPRVSGLQELCRVHGRVSLGGVEQTVDCCGTRSEVDGVQPDEIDSARAVSSWFGPDEAITVIALRARRAANHESDLIAATLFDPDGWVPVSDPRLSTTYTEAGDPARTSLELWVAEAEGDFPRRAAGEASGPATTLTAGGLELRVAPMRCHSHGLEGAGVYVLARLP